MVSWASISCEASSRPRVACQGSRTATLTSPSTSSPTSTSQTERRSLSPRLASPSTVVLSVTSRTLTGVHFQFNHEIAHRYLYKGTLGDGAHGVVHRVYDSVREDEVALKLYYDDAFDVQTAEAARQFQVAEGHCILPLLEVHTAIAEGQATVMPVAAGTLAKDMPMFASRAVYATRRVLTALEFCHGRRVIHGDVKPSNVFRDKHGNLLLGDFGVAGMTPEYAAPELLETEEKTVATDLWAVAVSFYELLCGEPPFGQRPDLDEFELAQRIEACDYTHPDDRFPFLPLRFREFFRGAFVAAPAGRAYVTAAGMRNALRDLSVHVEWVKVRKQDASSASKATS